MAKKRKGDAILRLLHTESDVNIRDTVGATSGETLGAFTREPRQKRNSFENRDEFVRTRPPPPPSQRGSRGSRSTNSSSNSKTVKKKPKKEKKKAKKDDTWGDDMFQKEKVPASPKKDKKSTGKKPKKAGLAMLLAQHNNLSLSSDDEAKLPPLPRPSSRATRGSVAPRSGHKIKVVFQEHMENEDYKPLLVPYNDNTTVEDLLSLALAYQQRAQPNLPTHGKMAEQYEFRLCEQDDSDYEVDEDLPPLTKQKLITDLNLRLIAMCFIGRPSAPAQHPELTNLSHSSTLDVGQTREPKHSFMLNKGRKSGPFGYVKILIPGPADTSITLPLDPEKNLTLRELVPLINRKRRQNLVNSEYFSYYYTEPDGTLHGGALPMSAKTASLTMDGLVLLPSVQTLMSIRNKTPLPFSDGLPYLLLLKPKDFKVWKVMEGRKELRHKKGRRLHVGQYLIRKIPLEDSSILKRDKHPIEIGKIQRIQRVPTNQRLFEIEYFHITGSVKKKKKAARIQTYEAVSDEQCSDIVDKINFLRKIGFYYGYEDPDGEVVKARKARTLTMIRGLKRT